VMSQDVVGGTLRTGEPTELRVHPFFMIRPGFRSVRYVSVGAVFCD
jgi:hypothetical protein